jgi:hypothetical protein
LTLLAHANGDKVCFPSGKNVSVFSDDIGQLGLAIHKGDRPACGSASGTYGPPKLKSSSTLPSGVRTMPSVDIDKVLIGLDYPQFSLAQATETPEQLDLSRSEEERILYGNAQALFALRSD